MEKFSVWAPEILNTHLSTNPYLAGELPSQLDAEVYEQFKNHVPNKILYPSLWRWYVWLGQYTAEARSAWTAATSNPDDPTKAEKAQNEVALIEGPPKETLSALLSLQKQREMAYAQYERELRELEMKYEKIYAPLYEKRKEIVESSEVGI